MKIPLTKNPVKANLATHFAFGALMSVLILLEIACAAQSYYTYGAIQSAFAKMLVIFNGIPIVLYLLRARITATLLAIILGALLVPGSMLASHELFLLQEEVAKIVAYAHDVRLKTGKYPKDLAGYKFINPDFKKDIDYEFDSSKNSLYVSYHVSGTNTMRWYNSESGWGYYDD